MFGLPTEFDPRVFVGSYLAKIGFGRGSVHLDFGRVGGPGNSDLLGIVIMGSYSYSVEGNSFDGNASHPQSGTTLVALLNSDVAEAKVVGRGDLVIVFSQRNHLHIKEDDSGFESYTVHLPGESEIVV